MQADINAAFGGNLNQALNTPQGQLASSIAAILGNVDDTFAFYTSQTDPAFALGAESRPAHSWVAAPGNTVTLR